MRRLAPFLVAVIAGCAVDPLIQLSRDLEGRDTEARRAAAVALGDTDRHEALVDLTDRLGAEEDARVLRAIAEAIVQHGRRHIGEGTSFAKAQRAIVYTAHILDAAHLEDVNREQAAWVLGEIGDRNAIPYLVPYETTAAQEALEKLGYYSVGRAFEVPMKGGR